MTDRERLLQILAATYAYYERELSQFVIQVWVEDLDGYQIDAVCAAFTAHRRDPDRGQWLPKSADILRQIHGDVKDAAQLAWSRVLSVAAAGGRGQLDDATREALHSLGGLSAIQRAPVDQNGFLQKRFMEAYAVYAKREREAPALLTGDVRKLLAGVAKASQ